MGKDGGVDWFGGSLSTRDSGLNMGAPFGVWSGRSGPLPDVHVALTCLQAVMKRRAFAPPPKEKPWGRGWLKQELLGKESHP